MKGRPGKNSIWSCSASLKFNWALYENLKPEVMGNNETEYPEKTLLETSLKLQDHKGFDARRKIKKLHSILLCRHRIFRWRLEERSETCIFEKKPGLPDESIFGKKFKGMCGVSYF